MATKEQLRWMEERKEWMKEWAQSRPRIIQELAEKLPFLKIIQFGCEKHGVEGKAYVIGYTEAGYVILSPINPGIDYEASMAARFYVNAEDLLESIRHTKTHDHGEHNHV